LEPEVFEVASRISGKVVMCIMWNFQFIPHREHTVLPFERLVRKVCVRKTSKFYELDRTRKHECTVWAKCRDLTIKISGTYTTGV
jgi:hypothetical protein